MHRMFSNTASRTNSWSDEDDIPPPPPPLSLNETQIVAFSLDADGCLFNAEYICSKKVVASNQSLLMHMTAKAQDTKNIVLLVGSNRQSQTIDKYNSIRNGTISCFVAIEEITAFLSKQLNQHQVRLDRFLLADIHSNVTEGTSFEQAINPLHTGPYNETVFDRSKITLIYAQIHKLACDHRGKQITYRFYDDRRDILDDLILFLIHHLDWIPDQMIIELYCYIGYKPRLLARLTGNGMINPDYSEQIKTLVKIGYEYPIQGEGFDVITAIKNDEMSRYRTLELPPITPRISDTNSHPSSNRLRATIFNTTIKLYDAPSLEEVSGSINTKPSPRRSRQATSLYFFIKYRSDKHLVSLFDKPVFRSAKHNSMNHAQFCIKQHNKDLGLIKRITYVGNHEYAIDQQYVLIYELLAAPSFYSDYCYTAQLQAVDLPSLSLSVYFDAYDQVIHTCLLNKDTGESFAIEEQDMQWIKALATMYSVSALSPLRKRQDGLRDKAIQMTHEKIQRLLSLGYASSEELNQCIIYSDDILKQLSWLTHITQLRDYAYLIDQYKRIVDSKYMILLSSEYDLMDKKRIRSLDSEPDTKVENFFQSHIIRIAQYKSYHKLGIRFESKPSALAFFDATQDAIQALSLFNHDSLLNDDHVLYFLYSVLSESASDCLEQLNEALIQGDMACANALSAFAPLLSDNLFKIAIKSTETHLLEWLLVHVNLPINRFRIASEAGDMSLLEYALTQNNLACFQLLLNYGASPIVLSTNGQPLAHVIVNTANSDFSSLLHAHIEKCQGDAFYERLSAMIIDCKIESPQRSSPSFFKKDSAEKTTPSCASSQSYGLS